MAAFYGWGSILVLAMMTSVLGISAFKFLRPNYAEENEPNRTFPEIPWKLAIAFCIGRMLLALAGAASSEYFLVGVYLALFGLAGAVIFLTFLYQVLA